MNLYEGKRAISFGGFGTKGTRSDLRTRVLILLHRNVVFYGIRRIQLLLLFLLSLVVYRFPYSPC